MTTQRKRITQKDIYEKSHRTQSCHYYCLQASNSTVQNEVENYKELYPLLNNQVKFLFEYAQSLFKMGQCTESNEILKRTMQISCDPMLYNIMGRKTVCRSGTVFY